MGDVIKFPMDRIRVTPSAEIDLNQQVEFVGPMEECSELIHVFDNVPGRCKCGENEWTELTQSEPGMGVHAEGFDVTYFGSPPAS